MERIESAILEIRDRKVLLDRDLAELYGVATKRLKEQVRRNRDRFPDDFMFQLTWDEVERLRARSETSIESAASRSQFATLKRGGNVKYLPLAFTEHGAVMLATILKTRRASDVSVFVVRAFIRMHQMLADQRQFAFKLAELESKLASHDAQFKVVFEAIRQLMQKPKSEPEKPRRSIGFQVRERGPKYRP
jgi:hypothetical protein